MTGNSTPPPGPAFPRLVQTLAFRLAPLRFTEACRRRYGDVVTFRGLEEPIVMVFNAELVRQMLRSSPDELTAWYDMRAAFGEHSVFALESAEHLSRRRKLAPHLHGDRMRMSTRVIREAADRAIDSWPIGEEFALLPSMQMLTFGVMARVALGLEDGPRREELGRRLLALTFPPPPGLLRMRRFGPSVGDRGPVEELLREEIRRRRADPDPREDALSTLLLARDGNGQPWTDQEVCDHLVTLLIAGMVTTAIGLAWAFEFLLRHPRVLERLEEELAGGDEDYLKAVVKETLRLRSPDGTVRRVVRDRPYALGGYRIPPGTEIWASVAIVQRRPDLYPEPHAFRPERFLGSEPEGDAGWLPFGWGAHRCLGASFATFEMGIVIRRVLERTRLRPAGRRPERATSFGGSPQRGARVVREPLSAERLPGIEARVPVGT